ncbi:MAG: PD40 domain-containing protein [Chloroflexi bacterium]|nr:PD40 domain-containing protein [Chloroflexota bacterium]
MKRSMNLIGGLIALLALVALGMGLVALFRDLSSTSGTVQISPLATPARSLTPQITPVVFQSPLATPTPAPAATPVVVPPPPNWPTGEPWPPAPSTPNVPPSKTPAPFPTPAFGPKPQGTPPAKLQSIWYLHYSSPRIEPKLQPVLVDEQGQRWTLSSQSINLDLRSEFPGPTLENLYPSSSQPLIIADVAYGESVQPILVDLSSATSRPIFQSRKGRFLAWTADGQNALVASDEGMQLFNPASQEYVSVNFRFPELEPRYYHVDAVAYSPDGSLLADAITYFPTVSKSTSEVEIGLSKIAQNTRTVVTRLPGDQAIPHSVAWSPDGQNLVVVLVVGIYDIDLTNDDTQLWLIDRAAGTSKILAQGLSPYPAVWSPNGKTIAFLKTNKLYLLDLATGTERQIAHLAGRQIQSFRWSAVGNQLVFSVSLGDYSEIWRTNLNGTQQHPIAGPSAPNAPFVGVP